MDFLLTVLFYFVIAGAALMAFFVLALMAALRPGTELKLFLRAPWTALARAHWRIERLPYLLNGDLLRPIAFIHKLRFLLQCLGLAHPA